VFFTNLLDKIFELAQKRNPNKVCIEDVAFQKALIQEVRNQMRIKNRFFTLEPILLH